MPPDILHFRPLLSPLVQFPPPLTTSAQKDQLSSNHKYFQGSKGKMNLTKKKLIPILVLILSIISILRLIMSLKTSYSSSHVIESTISQASQHNKVNASNAMPIRTSNITTTLTEKEFKVLSDLITLKSPCNLLIFGFQPQYLALSSMNVGGSTIILEDDYDKISKVSINSNTTQIYKLEYNNMPAKSAYKMLKHARYNPPCAPNSTLLKKSKCKLALKNLPEEVYRKKWDVIVIDGPIGDSAESLGRMGTIYSASVLARSVRNKTCDVVVHDVDRMVEKWFSWEFLCDENLLHSKGKLWHFRITGHTNSTTFCHARVSVT
ncbi:putative glucuronoxylan 4-O-methyltransferase [Lupinus albus]|uniref:Putative glucuronoxylan 4-O-methyltransferase n=1 Tax=Lupinus albus TaxID=3870 RepID=A0A6A4Q7K3_LUPAL|nr:putative glucuronoxylan 4-O-methyltransferase [Lupinus albus]